MVRHALIWARCLVTLPVLVLATGCDSSQYHWGRYESSMEAIYRDGSEEALTREIARLEKDIAKAESQTRPLPPGMQAHVGYLHFLLGDHGRAEEYFAAERDTYPESERFMNRLIEYVQ